MKVKKKFELPKYSNAERYYILIRIINEWIDDTTALRNYDKLNNKYLDKTQKEISIEVKVVMK